MAQTIINVGTVANDGTGDSIRQAGIYINNNFTEVFDLDPVKADIRFDGNTIKTQSSNADIDLSASGSGIIQLGAGIQIDDNNIKTIRSNDDIRIIPSGSGKLVIAGIGFSGTTMTADDSSSININENLIVSGTASVSGATTFSGAVSLDLTTLGVTGLTTVTNISTSSVAFGDGITVDNLTFNDNTISSSSNADINLTPGGTGTVNITSLTVDSSIKLFDNKIQTIQSNANLVLSSGGSGNVEVTSGLTTAAITTTGNVDITGTETITGQLDVEGIQIKDNKISTDESNSNLLISGSSSGNIVIDDVDIGGGAIDNVVIGGTTPAAGTFTTLVFSPTNTGTLSSTGVSITDNKITATQSNDNLEFNANGSGYVSINGFQLPSADGGTGQLLRTDASKVLTWVTSPVLLGSSDIQDGTATISFSTETVLDHVTSVGSHELISSTTSTINEFATAKYDSAWYLAVLRDDISDEFEVVKYSVLHGTTADGSTKDAFVTTSSQAKTGTNNHIIVDADISGGNVRLRGTGSSPQNSVSFWRIGLGDDDSTGYTSAETDEASIQKTHDATIGSTVVDLDTWGGAANTAAKYFISVKNTDTGEVGSMEALLTHDGSDSYVSVYNEHYSGNNSLLTITADYSGAARMRGSANAGSNTRVNMFRILLADTEGAETKTYTRTVANVTVSSTATVIDTFVDESGSESGYTAAHYIVSGQNGANERFVTEAAVVTDGTNVFITQYGNVSTKGTPMLELSVTHDGSSTVSLKALSTSGGSTTVNCWRVNLSRGEGTSTPMATLNTFDKSTYRSAAYNMQIVDSASGNYELFELRVTHDGSNAYVSKFGRVSNATNDLATITADISGSDVRIKGSISTTNDHVVKYVRKIIVV